MNLDNSNWVNRRLSHKEMELTNGSTGVESLVASFKPERRPIALRSGVIRVALQAHESFPTDGNAGAETFNLSNDLIDGYAPIDVVLSQDGRVEPTAINYAGDSVDVDDNGNAQTAHIYYMAGDPAELVFRKKAPESGDTQEFRVYQEALDLIHARDQGENPLRLGFGSGDKPVVPKDWRLNLYVDAPYNTRWDDSDDTDDGTSTREAVVSLPIMQAQRKVAGDLGQWVLDKQQGRR